MSTPVLVMTDGSTVNLEQFPEDILHPTWLLVRRQAKDDSMKKLIVISALFALMMSGCTDHAAVSKAKEDADDAKAALAKAEAELAKIASAKAEEDLAKEKAEKDIHVRLQLHLDATQTAGGNSKKAPRSLAEDAKLLADSVWSVPGEPVLPRRHWSSDEAVVMTDGKKESMAQLTIAFVADKDKASGMAWPGMSYAAGAKSTSTLFELIEIDGKRFLKMSYLDPKKTREFRYVLDGDTLTLYQVPSEPEWPTASVPIHFKLAKE
jgi:hypothetical protein